MGDNEEEHKACETGDGLQELYEKFLKCHINQLEKLKIPKHFWQHLFHKCYSTVFDAGEVFSFEAVECDCNVLIEQNKISCECFNQDLKVCVIKKDGISPDDGSQIYLIDHAWTYTTGSARKDLLENKDLCARLTALMNIPDSISSVEEVINKILFDMWRYNQGYSIIHPVNQNVISAWYVMDEFGFKIRHSPEPSFKTVPFFYCGPQSISYTLLFPVKEVSYGDEVTRNFVEGQYNDALTYQAVMLPWQPKDLTFVDFVPLAPSIEFVQSGRIPENVPDFECSPSPTVALQAKKLKVYSHFNAINSHLKHPAFEIVFDEKSADVLWLASHYKEFKELSSFPHKYINQFPFEHLLTCKNLLAAVCRHVENDYVLNESALETNPPWLPTTYILSTELCKFVSFFQQREKRGLDNIWICKPWNLCRGQDIHITSNLNQLLKLYSTCPKVVCKYITDPLLFPMKDVGLVKMDIRYIILLKSVKPLQLYVYKRFWLRFANKPFSLDTFEDYEKHFTVMNYNNKNLEQMYCQDFIKRFEEYHHPYKWNEIEANIFTIIKEIFSVASSKPPPLGLFQNAQSRAMYGLDLMLKWDKMDPENPKIQPVILEINYAPDCERACQYYPEFFNDVFEVLFLNENNANVVLL